MKDYMTALYLRFCGSPEQDPEAEALAQTLREWLDKEQRRTLLKLIDRYNAYCEAQAEAPSSPASASPPVSPWTSAAGGIRLRKRRSGEGALLCQMRNNKAYILSILIEEATLKYWRGLFDTLFDLQLCLFHRQPFVQNPTAIFDIGE